VALARAVAERHQQLTTRHAIRLELPESGLVGAWDPTRLDRAVSNLLSNAIKYSPNGGEVRVVLGRESVDGVEWATLAVHDRGIGIPRDDLERIFEPFHRADNVEGRVAGTGIGLSSARQVIEEYGGTLTATSEEGKGSTFTIRLPLDE
jgi:signal transduction histidine kinase